MERLENRRLVKKHLLVTELREVLVADIDEALVEVVCEVGISDDAELFEFELPGSIGDLAHQDAVQGAQNRSDFRLLE